MKFNSLPLSLAIAGMITVSGCATVEDSVSRNKYEADMAAKNAQIESLKASSQSSANSSEGHSSHSMSTAGSELFPPNAQPGHCYARVLIPAKYEDSSEQVMVSEASESIEVIPATYGTSEETVLVREASTRLVTVPPTYKTISEEIIDQPESIKLVPVPATYKEVSEQVLVRAASTRVETSPAEYGTETEQVLDKPAHTVWKKGAGFAGSAIQTNVDQSTGEIMCLVEVPATYKTITRRVLVSPATTQTIDIPAEYQTVTRTVVDTPATVQEVVIPATYKTVTRQVIESPASSNVIEIPAEYQTVPVTTLVSAPQEVRTPIPAVYDTVTKRSKVSEEELVWREVLCDVNVTRDVVSTLQTKLKDAGHYSNVIDGIWGADTQKGINSFSVAEGLPTGTNYIPLETASALGIEL